MVNMLIIIIAEIIDCYALIVIANAILSWFIHGTYNPTVQKIYRITSQLVDPILTPIRRLLSPMTRNFGLDISPFILIMFLHVLSQMIAS